MNAGVAGSGVLVTVGVTGTGELVTVGVAGTGVFVTAGEGLASVVETGASWIEASGKTFTAWQAINRKDKNTSHLRMRFIIAAKVRVIRHGYQLAGKIRKI